MEFIKISIDIEVYKHLQESAEPFKDSENDVLRKLLDLNGKTSKKKRVTSSDIPTMSSSALQQILEVYSLIRTGRTRNEATKYVAEQRNIAYQSVLDKYTRQLGKVSGEIDELFRESNRESFKVLLKEKFPSYKNEIDSFFDEL